MSQISQVRRCYNCGAILQSDDPSREGYVRKETLENGSQNFLFCDKCFELERYKSVSNEPLVDPDFIKLIKDAKAKNALLVYVINLFSFEASFNHEVCDVLKDMRILVVANKFDLLPKGTSKLEIKKYVIHTFKKFNLFIKDEDIMIANAFDEEATKAVINRIYEMKNGKDVYFIGPVLAGKTTLLSEILKVYSNLSQGNIVTEYYPGTNLKVMQIPLNSKTKIFDSPGIGMENSILYNLDRRTLRDIYLLDPVEPRKFVLLPRQSFYIGGIAIVELLEGKRTVFTCYFHDKIQLKRASNKKVDEKFVKLIAKKGLRPSLASIKSTKDLDVFDIEVNEKNQRDIGIQGLGWVSFKANEQKIRIYVPKGVSVYQSRAKIIEK